MANTRLESARDFAFTYGQNGQRWIDTGETSVVGEVFFLMYVVLDASVSYDSLCPGGDKTISSETIPAGVPIYGKMTNVSVASGKVLCYLV